MQAGTAQTERPTYGRTQCGFVLGGSHNVLVFVVERWVRCESWLAVCVCVCVL